MYGHPSYMPRIIEIAEKYDLRIIEDSAEAHGASYRSIEQPESSFNTCGSQGDMSTFSFYANKNITTGEGGMVLTNDSELHERLLKLRNLGFGKDRNYIHEDFGYQFRLSSMQAALGINQIKRIDKIVERKKKIYESYLSRLQNLDYLDFLKIEEWARPSYWVVPIILKSDFSNSEEFRRILLTKGVETRPLFLGLNRQPIYKNQVFHNGSEFSNSDYVYKFGLFLPSGVGTTEDDIDFVCSVIEDF